MFDILTNLTELGVVTAEGDQLFTDGAASVGLPLALLGVAHHPLHLVTARQSAVGVSALTRVHQALYTALDAELPRLLRVAGGGSLASSAVKIEAELLHLVGVAVLLIARHAQVKVVTDCTVVPGLNGLGTGVAGVHKFILTLKENVLQVYKILLK